MRRTVLPIRVGLLACLLTLGAPTLAQTPVRVVTWNIETVGAPGTAEYQAALSVLLRISADVVGVNEINGAADALNFTQLAAAAGGPSSLVQDPNPFGAMRNCHQPPAHLTADGVHVGDSIG